MTTIGEALRKLEAIRKRLDPHQRGVDLTDLSTEAVKFISENLREIQKGLFKVPE